MRRGHGERGEGPGDSGGGGGAAAKTKQLGLYDQAPEYKLEEATRESRIRWGYDVLGLPWQSAFYQIPRRGSRFSR